MYCLLLLRIICFFASSRFSGRRHEENCVRLRLAGINCHYNHLLARKFTQERRYNFLFLIISENMQIPAKFIFVHILRGSRHLNTNTLIHWTTWIGCTFGVAVIAFIIASTVPVFDSLVSLIGALLGPLMCFQPMGCMWLYDNWSKDKRHANFWIAKTCWSVFVVILGCFLTVAGTYGSVVGIMDAYKESGGSAAFSCTDNSNST